jgi:hypothetical protein
VTQRPITCTECAGQINCWLTKDPDPYKHAPNRLFSVTTTHGLVLLCQEFLVEKAPVTALRTEMGKPF